MIAHTSTVPLQPSPPQAAGLPAGRLASLDVFRGLVIFAMLIVNNLGDYSTTGYWWKHAGWIATSQAEAYRQWWASFAALPWHAIAQFPLLRHCTLADFVMPWFMLIIGVAIPFSVAAAKAKQTPPAQIWARTLRRAAVLVVLGWTIDNSIAFSNWYHSASRDARYSLTLGMDVLQLLGLSYLAARILYILPPLPRLAAALALLVYHWALLRFLPQGDVPAGTFTEQHNAAGYIYSSWAIFRPVDLVKGRITISFVGMLSVPPATAAMLLGTLAGDPIQRQDISDKRKVLRLIGAGALSAILGFLWAFDLPFNKPRWSPPYLLYTCGIGVILLGIIYWIVEIRRHRRWAWPLVVFGVNAIAAYWLSIMAKVWLLNTPRLRLTNGSTTILTNWILAALKHNLGPHLGGWTFTFCFVGFWWLVLEQMHRRKIHWKI